MATCTCGFAHGLQGTSKHLEVGTYFNRWTVPPLAVHELVQRRAMEHDGLFRIDDVTDSQNAEEGEHCEHVHLLSSSKFHYPSSSAVSGSGCDGFQSWGFLFGLSAFVSLRAWRVRLLLHPGPWLTNILITLNACECPYEYHNRHTQKR